ncbi:MAG: RNA polymerase sigma factor RpoD/SigA, partial [Pontibacterium sp.]
MPNDLTLIHNAKPTPMVDNTNFGSVHDISAANALDIYSQQINRYPLLTTPQEQLLGEKINTCVSLIVSIASTSFEGTWRLQDTVLDYLTVRLQGIAGKSWDLSQSPAEVEDQLLTFLDTLGVLLHMQKQDKRQTESLRNQVSLLIMSLSMGRHILVELAENLIECGCLTPTNQIALRTCLKQYDTLRSELVNSNLRLVYKVAHRYTHTGVHINDLIQEGNIGLIKAADRFNFTRGYKFSTYAFLTIQNVIKSAVQQRYHLIARPAYLQEKLSVIRDAKSAFKQSTNKHPTRQALSKATGIDENTLSRIEAFPRSSISLNQPLKSDPENSNFEDVLDLDQSSYDDMDSEISAKQAIAQLIGHLTEREAQVLKLRYGIECREAYTLEAIANMLGISTERVRQIQ